MGEALDVLEATGELLRDLHRPGPALRRHDPQPLELGHGRPCSITLVRLDDELSSLLDAPAEIAIRTF